MTSPAYANAPKPPPDKAWMGFDLPSEAHIERRGRWTYLVSVHHGITIWAPDGIGWYVLGRRRAERKARRVLARYVRQLTAGQDVQVVTLGPYVLDVD